MNKSFFSLFTFLNWIVFSTSVFSQSFYDLKAKDIRGREVKFSQFQGKTILVVNVASRCGYTPQYEGLENLYRKYKDRGFMVLGFPANNFGNQEPGKDEEIAEFCRLNYGVTFPMMSKISVKGKDIHPVYQFLLSHSRPQKDIQWNFEKFLIGKKGELIARFPSHTRPEDPEFVRAILEHL